MKWFTPRTPKKPQGPQLRIAILGAGPIGIEAALYAAALGMPFKVYERGHVGEHVRRWGHVPMFTPFGTNTTALGVARLHADYEDPDLPAPDDVVTGRDYCEAYLEQLAACEALEKRILPETEVVAIARRGFLKEDRPGDVVRAGQPFRLLVRDAKKAERTEEADVILDCTGTYGHHRYLGEGGIPAQGEAAAGKLVSYGLDDILGAHRDRYKDKTVLVVGSGYSAATSVTLLAKLAEAHPYTWVVWLARGEGSQPIKRFLNDPLRERDRVAVEANTLATRTDGNVEFHPSAQVESLEAPAPDQPVKVRATVDGKEQTWSVDRVIANVGYTPSLELTRELQVEVCPTWLSLPSLRGVLPTQRGVDLWGKSDIAASSVVQPEPNYFVLGAKSLGRFPHFFLRTGFEQVRQAFALLTKQPKLNLYEQAAQARAG